MMAHSSTPTILCLSSYEKGAAFLQECRRQGWQVILVTVPALEHAAFWPKESIDAVYTMPDLADAHAVINGVSYLARSQTIDRIVALDEYDVMTAAALREHLRLPGMGESATRLVRDKLAMRVRAHQAGLPVPEFVHALNDAALRDFMATVPGPWLLKPRSEASTIGISKLHAAEELWPKLDTLGDQRSHFLLERYVPGDVYHADSIVAGGEVVFAEAHGYVRPPLDVFHEGGVAATATMRRQSEEAAEVRELNQSVLRALGVQDSATHMEFIRAHEDGRLYFLEVAARVGGAYISDVVEAATGVNLWVEWAKLETATGTHHYQAPVPRRDYASVIISLARQEVPDTSAYQDPEIVWRLEKPYHVGFLIASPDHERLATLLTEYSRRIADDFMAALPPWTARPPAES